MIAVKEAQYYTLNMKTRMPFRYGIATLSALPHVFLALTVQVDGKMSMKLYSQTMGCRKHSRKLYNATNLDISSLNLLDS